MNYKQKLVQFVILKNKIIEKIENIKYADEKDIETIKQWHNTSCKYIYDKILDRYSEGLGVYTCPWCIKNEMRCAICEYGERHGICDQTGSLFNLYDTLEVDRVLSDDTYRHIISICEK